MVLWFYGNRATFPFHFLIFLEKKRGIFQRKAERTHLLSLPLSTKRVKIRMVLRIGSWIHMDAFFFIGYFLLQYILSDLLSFEISQGTFKRATFLKRTRVVCSYEDWQSVLMLLSGGCSRWCLFLTEGRFSSSKSGLIISIVLKGSLPLSGTSLRIVIIGKKLKKEPFLLCNQVVWKKMIMKSHLMEANRTLIMWKAGELRRSVFCR